MLIKADLKSGELKFPNGPSYPITCRVRSRAQRTRNRDEVVRTIPGEKPYDPQPFPTGIWKITAIEHIPYSKTYGSIKIRTNAHQLVKVWHLDKDGDYEYETDDTVDDSGYLLHYSESSTTLGCIRLNSIHNAEDIAGMLKVGDELEVVR